MWRRLSTGVCATLVAVSIWVGVDPLAPPPPDFAEIATPASVSRSTAHVLGGLGDSMAVEPVIFAPIGSGPNLQHNAAEAVAGAALVAGTDLVDDEAVGGRWRIDLTGSPVMADRIALGLIQRAVPFERSIEVDDFGDVGSVLNGSGSIAQFLVVPSEMSRTAATTRLATIVELAGSPRGRLGPAMHATAIAELADVIDLDLTMVDGAPSVSSIEALETVAGFAVTDPSNVPGLAGRPSPASRIENIPLTAQAWTAATTGPLIPGATHSLCPEQGGVGWTNREAQTYDPAAVSFATDADDSALVLHTESSGPPSIDALPFRSGMVIAERTIGWGTLEVEVTLPAGDGLWPAVWLLDAHACDVPGRCPNYATTAYHEIDLIETRGDQPGEAYTSLHWFDERLRSTSGTAPISTDRDGRGGRVTVSVERRPGLIVWRLDGEVVYAVGGEVVVGEVASDRSGEPTNRASVETGPHRSQPMQLVINTAVGGNFAGDRIIGRSGQWWGDAQVPDSFPNLEWESATLSVHSVTFTPIS